MRINKIYNNDCKEWDALNEWNHEKKFWTEFKLCCILLLARYYCLLHRICPPQQLCALVYSWLSFSDPLIFSLSLTIKQRSVVFNTFCISAKTANKSQIRIYLELEKTCRSLDFHNWVCWWTWGCQIQDNSQTRWPHCLLAWEEGRGCRESSEDQLHSNGQYWIHSQLLHRASNPEVYI